MIAKFHSAPGHSMETTLTISLPPVQSVKTSRAEREREKEREREWEREQAREKEKREKKEKKKEEQEREKELAKMRQIEAQNESIRQREREREQQLREQEKASRAHHSERNVSYKDKFQRMREKYDKATHVHESSQRELDTLHAKIKKLQAENELLLDAMLTSETTLYETYFPRSGSSSPLLGPSDDPIQPTPTAISSNTPSQMPTPHPAHYNDVSRPPPHSGSSGSNPASMAPPTSIASSGAPPPPPSAAFRTMPPPLSPMAPPSTVTSNGTSLASNMMPPPLSTASSSNGSSSVVQRTSSNEQRSVHYESPESGRSRRASGRRMNPAGWTDPAESEEPIVNGDGPRTPTRMTAPVAVSAGETVRERGELGPTRSPRVNGTAGPVISNLVIANGFGSAASPRRQIEPSRDTTPLVAPQSNHQSNHLRDDDDDRMDGGNDEDDEGPSPPGPDAGAGVHSPTDAEDEEDRNARGMDVDVEADDDEAKSVSPIDISPRLASSIGSLRRGARGRT